MLYQKYDCTQLTLTQGSCFMDYKNMYVELQCKLYNFITQYDIVLKRLNIPEKKRLVFIETDFTQLCDYSDVLRQCYEALLDVNHVNVVISWPCRKTAFNVYNLYLHVCLYTSVLYILLLSYRHSLREEIL